LSTLTDKDDERGRLLAENARLERVNEELRELNAERAKVLNIVSHELRNPLVTIRGYIEMIARHRLGPLTDQQERGLSVALRNTIALSEQIDVLVEYTRIEANTLQFALESTDLGKVLHKACASMVEPAKRSGLVIHTELPPDRDVRVIADEDKLVSVLRTLLNNAIKFTDSGGIRVHVGPVSEGDDDLVEVSVIDTGSGIAPSDQESIFKAFTQGPGQDGRLTKGAGLGLYVASVLVAGHGSELRCESRLAEGSRFWFRLPRVS